MHKINDRFITHPLQASLSELHELVRNLKIDKACTEDLENVSSRRESVAIFLRIYRFITRSIQRSDRLMWTPNTLNNALTSVNHLKKGLTDFSTSNNQSYLDTASDNALDYFRNALVPQFAVEPKDSATAFTTFCDQAEKSLRSIEEIEQVTRNQCAELDKSKQDFTHHLAKLSERIENFKTEFEAQKSRVDALITSQQQAFQTAQDERHHLFSQESESRQLASKKWVENADTQLQDLLKNTQLAADSHLGDMAQHQARAKEILGIVAASGVSGHYQKVANRELIAAEILRIAALTCFTVMAFLIYQVVQSLGPPKTTDIMAVLQTNSISANMSPHEPIFQWQMGLFRLGVGLALLVPAHYCTRESAKHREAGNRNRRLQIELATIEPYLEKLNDDPAMRGILKEKANSYFMGNLPKEPNDESHQQEASRRELRRRENQVMDLLKTLAASIRK